jgi:hypothetical protein
MFINGMTALEIATQITSWRKDQGILEELSTATYTDWMRCFREVGWTIASNTTFSHKFGGEGLTDIFGRAIFEVQEGWKGKTFSFIESHHLWHLLSRDKGWNFLASSSI